MVIFISTVTVVLLTVQIAILVLYPSYKKAVHVKMAIPLSEMNVGEYVGQEVTLLCETEQATGRTLYPTAIKLDDGKFHKISIPNYLHFVCTGYTPHSVLSEELTIYNENSFILKGILRQTIHEDALVGLSLDSFQWDIVYPVNSLLRLPFFYGNIYDFDLIQENNKATLD